MKILQFLETPLLVIFLMKATLEKSELFTSNHFLITLTVSSFEASSEIINSIFLESKLWCKILSRVSIIVLDELYVTTTTETFINQTNGKKNLRRYSPLFLLNCVIVIYELFT